MKFLALILYLIQPFQDAQLATVKASLMTLRDQYDDHRATKGAAEDLTRVKHQLRDWVESRLATLPENVNTAVLTENLYNAVKFGHLFCSDRDDDCFENALGYLDEIEVNKENDFLIIKTAIGLFCSFDYSAYIYAWRGDKWQRVWENEQNTYTEKDYAPQVIHSVHISAPDKNGNRLILTLGSRGGCIPAYIPLYYRAWQVNSDFSTAKPVLDGKETALDGFPPVQGKVGPDDVLLAFTVGGIGYGSSHQAVRHFEIREQRAQQVDPIAATPRDFVEEWISGDWAQSGARSAKPALRAQHMKVHRTDGMGDFPDPAVHCKSSPDLWQVGTHWHEGPKTYYLVRWTLPYKFTMMDVKDTAFTDCITPDPKGDKQPTLFDQN